MVMILGTEYEIELLDEIEGNLYGLTCSDEKTIKVKISDDSTTRRTVLHEIVHAILFESGMTWLLESSPGLEEGIVRALEHGLWQAGYRRKNEKSPPG